MHMPLNANLKLGLGFGLLGFCCLCVGILLYLVLHPTPQPMLPADPAPIDFKDISPDITDPPTFSIFPTQAQPLPLFTHGFSFPHPEPILPLWRKNAQNIVLKTPQTKGQIILIIDDLGLDRVRTQQIIDLPAPLTLAFLPYAPDVREQSTRAYHKGHEILVHVPMQPLNDTLDPGPSFLRVDHDAKTIHDTLSTMLDLVPKAVGINNHMGSLLTQDEQAMTQVMKTLSPRGLAFIDSRTNPHSVGRITSAQHGIPFASRDVFLDHEETTDFVLAALEKLEQIAHTNGQAIAIGHPKDVTIHTLRTWIPTLPAKNLQIIPITYGLQKGALWPHPNQKNTEKSEHKE